MKKISVIPKKDIDYIINILRQGTVKWEGRRECLRKARKKVFVRRSQSGKAIYKFHWQCAECKRWSKNEKLMEVDHIVELGTFRGDWNDYISRLFCKENLQTLCIPCHLKKTKRFNSARTKWKRKIPLK